MKRFMTESFRQKLIDIKGTSCCNCEKECGNQIIFHHIVPVVLGGTDNISNLTPLCEDCHNLIHLNKKTINHYTHSDLVKMGINRARAEGKKVGRPQTSLELIPLEFKENYYPLIKSNKLTITEASRQLNMSRTTIYKYIYIIDGQKSNQ